MSLFALQAEPSPEVVAAAVADAVEAAHNAASEAWLTDMSALALAQELADMLDAPINEVWHSLCNVPANMVTLLDSPQGWSALAVVVAYDLGLPPPDYSPQVH